MNHATLTALMLAGQNYGNKLYSISPDASGPRRIKLSLYHGADIISHCDGSWELTVDPTRLSRPAIDFLNLHTNESFALKKLGVHKYSFAGGFVAKQLQVAFKPDGTFTVISGLVLDDDALKAKTKALHSLTRRVRKKVQPQIRLLGASAFVANRDEDHKHQYGPDRKNEIDVLMNILDGNEVVKNLNILRATAHMGEIFGNGHPWRRKSSSELQPKKIVDVILRRVGKHKFEILEKYDERTRANQQNT